MADSLLTSKQAADYLGISQAFLERDRWAGARVPYVQIGARAVRYRTADLNAFIESRVRCADSKVSK